MLPGFPVLPRNPGFRVDWTWGGTAQSNRPEIMGVMYTPKFRVVDPYCAEATFRVKNCPTLRDATKKCTKMFTFGGLSGWRPPPPPYTSPCTAVFDETPDVVIHRTRVRAATHLVCGPPLRRGVRHWLPGVVHAQCVRSARLALHFRVQCVVVRHHEVPRSAPRHGQWMSTYFLRPCIIGRGTARNEQLPRQRPFTEHTRHSRTQPSTRMRRTGFSGLSSPTRTEHQKVSLYAGKGHDLQGWCQFQLVLAGKVVPKIGMTPVFYDSLSCRFLTFVSDHIIFSAPTTFQREYRLCETGGPWTGSVRGVPSRSDCLFAVGRLMAVSGLLVQWQSLLEEHPRPRLWRRAWDACLGSKVRLKETPTGKKMACQYC